MEDARLRDMRGRTERLKAGKPPGGGTVADSHPAEDGHGDAAGKLDGAGRQLEGAGLSDGASALESLPEQLGPPRANEEWRRFYEAISRAVQKQRE